MTDWKFEPVTRRRPPGVTPVVIRLPADYRGLPAEQQDRFCAETAERILATADPVTNNEGE